MGKNPIKLVTYTCLGLALLAYLHEIQYFSFLTDDSFISFRYARNLAEGMGLVFNEGEYVDGYSNFLWTILMSAFIKLGFSPLPVSKILGAVFGVATILSAWIFSKKRLGDTPSNTVAALILSILGPFTVWTTGGLETMMYTFLLTSAILSYTLEREGLVRKQVSQIFFILASLTRTEGFAVFLAVAGFRLIDNHFNRKQLFSVSDVKWFMPVLLVYTAYFLWHYHYYGYPMSNSAYAKIDVGERSIRKGIVYLEGFFRSFPWLLLGFIPAIKLFASKVKTGKTGESGHWITLASYTALVNLALIAALGGDFMGMYRFLTPITPILALLVQSTIRLAYNSFRDSMRNRIIPNTAAIILLALILEGTFTASHGVLEGRITGMRDNALYWSRIGHFLGEHFDEDTSIGVYNAGAIPYYSRMRVLDTNGLCNRYIALNGVKIIGFASIDREYVVEQKPDLIYDMFNWRKIPEKREMLGEYEFINIRAECPQTWEYGCEDKKYFTFALWKKKNLDLNADYSIIA